METEKSSDGQIKRLHYIPRPASKEGDDFCNGWPALFAYLLSLALPMGVVDTLVSGVSSQLIRIQLNISSVLTLKHPIEPETFRINPFGIHFALL